MNEVIRFDVLCTLFEIRSKGPEHTGAYRDVYRGCQGVVIPVAGKQRIVKIVVQGNETGL